MKKTAVFLLFLFFMSSVSWSQDTDATKRNIKLTIIDKKERPMKNVKASSMTGSQSGKTDQSGQFDFKNMTDDSSISVFLPGGVGETSIPVTGLDEIILKRQSATSYSYKDKNAQNVLIEKVIKKSGDILDVPAILERRQASSLIDLLKGNMPGLMISPDNKASVRGISTFDHTRVEQTYEVTVFVDGNQAGTLSDVSGFLNVHDIQTIELNKSGSGYGLQGANGVLLITTKRNSDNKAQ